jgi:delta24(24(1))-sterol reductase
MAPQDIKDEIVVKTEDTKPDAEFVFGNGVEKRPRSPRKASGPKANGVDRVKGKPAHKVDTSGHFDFGGPVGVSAMMLLFPVLMYYLWICSTFYGGSLQVKKSSETWLAFADRMVAHVSKVYQSQCI